MALKPEQVTELNSASERVIKGLGTATDSDNLNYAAKQGYKYTPATAAPSPVIATDPNALADAVAGSGKTEFQQGTGIGGYDAALAAESKTKTDALGNSAPVSGTDWMTDWMKSAFGVRDDGTIRTTGADTIKAPTFEVEKSRLTAARDSRLAALDTTYSTDLATVQKNNKNAGNALKARLMKLGVSPTDSAWSNAEAGQLQRDTEAEAKLRSEYLSNKAKIEADVDSQLTTVAMNEATMNFNAAVKNIENKLTTQAQGISLYNIFSNRDQSEKDREQKAYGDMLQYQGTMATLDQRQQEAISKNFIDNAQKGMYNVSDKNTLEMLSKLEKESPYLVGLTNIATAGLSDRLDKKAQDAANLAKTNWDIKNIQSTIADRGKSSTGTKDATKLKLLNEYAGYIDQQLHTKDDGAGNLMSTKEVRPDGLTVAEYQTARQGAILAGLAPDDFDATFASAISDKNRYAPAQGSDTGSYVDKVTNKLVNLKTIY